MCEEGCHNPEKEKKSVGKEEGQQKVPVAKYVI